MTTKDAPLIDRVEKVRELMAELQVSMNDLDLHAFIEDVLNMEALNDAGFEPDLGGAFTALSEDGVDVMEEHFYDATFYAVHDSLEEHGFLPEDPDLFDAIEDEEAE